MPKSCRATAHERMPFILRHGLLGRRTAQNWIDRQMWAKRVHIARKHWLTEMRKQRSLVLSKKGKADRNTSKLHRLQGISLPGGSIENSPDRMASLIQRHFANKWASGRGDAYLDLVHLASSAEGLSPNFTLQELHSAFESARRKTRFDDDGICVLAFELLFET